MSDDPVVHRCPACELRFRFRTELVDHLRREHPDRDIDADPYHRGNARPHE